MIFILPVSHDVQLGKHLYSGKYESYLLSAIPNLKISLVCEELSEDDINANVHDYIARRVANKFSVPYLLVEPTDEERKRLGIPLSEEILAKMDDLTETSRSTGIYPLEAFERFRQEMTVAHQKREQYWLKKIKDKKKENILFIVGIGHLSFHRDVHGEGFDKLLISEDFQVEILSTGFVNPKYF